MVWYLFQSQLLLLFLAAFRLHALAFPLTAFLYPPVHLLLLTQASFSAQE
jgi:hypothetical protein